jgi:hypothetical protein
MRHERRNKRGAERPSQGSDKPCEIVMKLLAAIVSQCA